MRVRCRCGHYAEKRAAATGTPRPGFCYYTGFGEPVTPPRKTPLTYRDAGVDIEAGDALVEAIKPLAERTRRPGWLAGLGGFGSLFALPAGLKEPVLVAGTDGVGTKLKLAIDTGRHEHIGIDLVAMCVNDVVVQGAEPLFFLDYFASARLDLAVAQTIIAGIARGCEQAGCALVGGETAEMPGLYADGDYDLAGFCVGVVEKARIIDGSGVRAGDALIGLASSGVHSNGFSLVRRILNDARATLDTPFQERTLADALLAPTRIYVRAVLALARALPLSAAAHITGGGLPGNVPRVLPPRTRAIIDTQAFVRPPIFDWLQAQGGVARDEMFRTFNCGLGMVLVVPAADAEAAMALLKTHGEDARLVGRIEAQAAEEPGIVLE